MCYLLQIMSRRANATLMIILQNSRLLQLQRQLLLTRKNGSKNSQYSTKHIIKSACYCILCINMRLQTCYLLYKSNLSNLPMHFIEQLDRYCLFTKEHIFDNLHSAITSQIAFNITNNHTHNRQINTIKTHLQTISTHKASYPSFGQQIDAFTNMFTCYISILQAESDRSKSMIDKLQTQILLKIEQCETVFLDIQKRIVKYGKEEMQKLNKDIQFHQTKIKENENQIEEEKKKCFIRLMEFAREQNEQNIKIKFKTQQSFENMKKYGKINSEMHGFFEDSIPVFEENIFEELANINKVQKEKQQLFQKVAVVFSQAQEEKVALAQQFSHIFDQSFQISQIKIGKLPYTSDVVEIPKKGVIPKLKYLKTAVDLCLHPHPQNQVIIAHRQSLQNSLNYNVQNFEQVLLSENFHIDTSNMTVQDKQAKKYELCKLFITEIRDVYKNCQKQIPNGYQQRLQEVMRNKGYRELFVFFMYQICKASKHQKAVNPKQEDFICKTSNICLKKCHSCFDGQTALKIILLSFHLKTANPSYFSSKLYLTPFIENFEFWSSIFIENIYEYCQMIVIYYHNKIQEMNYEQHNRHQESQRTFWSFLKPIQTLFKPNQQQKVDIIDPIRSIYHQIIKNVFTFQICLMRLIHVSKQVEKKIVIHIFEAIQSLNFSPEIESNLKKCLELITLKEQQKLLQLIRSQLILQRSLCKLFGMRPQENEVDKTQQFSISQMINLWYRIE